MAPAPGRARMISGMPLPCTRCWTGTGPVRTSTGGCRCCPRISGTSTRPAPTGTSKRSPSCCELVGQRLAATARCAVMTALAPALQAFFTDRLITQRNSQPADDRGLPRHVHAAAALRARPDRQAAVRAGHRRPRRAADRRLPHPPRTRPRQQCPHPQRPPRRDPLLLPFRRARTSRARAHDRAGHGDPDQAPRTQHRLLPRPHRDHRAARRARPRHLARPPRPRTAGTDDPDRGARLRTGRPATSATSTSAPAATSGSWARDARSARHR